MPIKGRSGFFKLPPSSSTYRQNFAKMSKSLGLSTSGSSDFTEGFLSMTFRKSAMMKDPTFKKLLAALQAGMDKAVPVTNKHLLAMGMQIRDAANARAPVETGNLIQSGVVVTANPKYRDFQKLSEMRYLPGHGRERVRYNRTDEADRSYAAIRKSLRRENKAGGIKVLAGMRVSYAAEYALLVHEDSGTPSLRNSETSHFLEKAVESLDYGGMMDILANKISTPTMRAITRAARRNS